MIEDNQKKFLDFEKLTKPNEELKRIAKSLCGKTKKETAINILNFLKKTLRYVDLERKDPKRWKKLFRKRSARQILKTKISYGCGETATLFVALCRLCNIPAKFVEGKRLKKSGGHSWARIWLDNHWVDVDPTKGKEGINFDPEKAKHGPYIVLSESLGPSDSAITCYQDWRRIEKSWNYRKKKSS
jgi:hypothetical protein